ncbi:MAG: dTDP-4-dehydrorhamnose reductase [Erythrobacteraceae bacterium]|jgi:dTDP-4-dehydrorhamnose reductase|nr:dTDP-4-dehydrorhamnose reductase [Erythrobacteraceae bacterium]|tara:strand:+ start:1750 stop:2598 length:849 start_codon:yes stop_codon:yes gene_type:complete
MKVLITGARGQLGSSLIDSAPANVEVCAVGRVECDLLKLDSITELVGDVNPDLVINAAAYTAVDNAEHDEVAARIINAETVRALVKCHTGKLVHISTDFVFDGQSSRPYRPHDKRAPLSVYGHTKAAGEDHLRDSDILVRTSWVYNAGGSNFVRTMLRLMRERSTLKIVADQIGSPTWAPGLADTIWNLIDKDAAGTFHHSDAGVASWYDFAVAIQEEALAIGLLTEPIRIAPIPSTDYPTPASRPAFSLLDCSDTRELLEDNYIHWRTNLRLMLKQEMALG